MILFIKVDWSKKVKFRGVTFDIPIDKQNIIPIELRNKFGITEKDPMEIYVDGSSIILKKYEPNCIFCGSSKKLIDYQGRLICEKCAEKIGKAKAV